MALSPTHMPKGKVVAGRWRIRQKLGEGGFGAVYKVVNVETNTLAALKVERIRKHGVLKLEAMILRQLDDYPFVPHLLCSGKKPAYSYIILTLLGPSLNKIMKLYGRICSVSTQVRVGINTLYAIKQIHDIGFLHRDLKPGNLAVGPIGTPQFRLIHIFDFGLARQYVITSGGERPKLRRPRPRVHFRGTLRYCSINCQQKGEQGRDDDLWCFLYMLAELRGPLPWASIREGPRILKMKQEVALEQLLENCPVEFIFIAQHLMTLDYYSRPNYALLYRLLSQVMHAGNFKFSDPYDWELKSSIPSSAECATLIKSDETQPQTSNSKNGKEYNPFPAEFFEENPFGF
ncbi:hypothetical protein V3C99_011213 [Haemonchus contortus]